MLHRRLVLVAATIALAGCASSSAASASSSGTAAPRRDTSVITAEELASIPTGDLYSAVQQLRPTFLQTRGVTSPGIATAAEVLNVYVNGIRTGDVQVLHQIAANEVKEVRRLSASEATQRFGTGHTMGAILVTRK
jgi:hypothetical protein